MVFSIPETNSFSEHLRIDLESTFDINIYEMRAVLAAFYKWQHLWTKGRIIVYTDNTIVYTGLQKQTLNSPANIDLRSILCEAANWDIIVESRWILGKANTLANALSRFDSSTIADICPHWQISSPSQPHHQHGALK